MRHNRNIRTCNENIWYAYACKNWLQNRSRQNPPQEKNSQLAKSSPGEELKVSSQQEYAKKQRKAVFFRVSRNIEENNFHNFILYLLLPIRFNSAKNNAYIHRKIRIFYLLMHIRDCLLKERNFLDILFYKPIISRLFLNFIFLYLHNLLRKDSLNREDILHNWII